MICYSNPGSHPFISKEEREYLQTELGQLKRNDNLPPTPWISILTSVPMIALVCAQVTETTETNTKCERLHRQFAHSKCLTFKITDWS